MKAAMYLLTSVLVVAVLSGCGQRSVEEAPQTETSASANQTVSGETVSSNEASGKPAVGESTRATTTDLEFVVDGQSETVPATLYVGQGYSIYIPNEGWRLEREVEGNMTEETWESTVRDDVELSVYTYGAYPGGSLAATKASFAADSDYVFENPADDGSTGVLTGVDEDGDRLSFMGAEGQDGVTYIIAWKYPAGAAESFSARLPVIAGTFAVTES